MNGRIYLWQGDSLVAMTEAAYEAEAVLQQLLAEYPDLLAGDQMRPAEPRRWLLVDREVGVPDAPGASGRWSMDHLFVDQDSVPTIVEVKRSSDTRLRREVVGQILDYAANIMAHWPASEVQATFESRCRQEGLDSNAVMTAFLNTSPTESDGETARREEFWRLVEQNMEARRLRLVFVADIIPVELQRIVEFLNEGLVRTEVLAIEVKLFVSEDSLTKTLVPRVIGQTSTAIDTKRTMHRSRITPAFDEAGFLDEARSVGGDDVANCVQDVAAWMRSLGLEPSFGAGRTGPMYLDIRLPDGRSIKPMSVNTAGRVEVLFNNMGTIAPFTDVEFRQALRRQLNEIPRVSIKEEQADRAGWPGISFESIRDPEGMSRFKEAFAWVTSQIRQANP